MNENDFQKSIILIRGDPTAAAKKKAESRALKPILETILRPSLTREQQVLALMKASSKTKVHVHLVVQDY